MLKTLTKKSLKDMAKTYSAKIEKVPFPGRFHLIVSMEDSLFSSQEVKVIRKDLFAKDGKVIYSFDLILNGGLVFLRKEKERVLFTE